MHLEYVILVLFCIECYAQLEKNKELNTIENLSLAVLNNHQTI